MAADIGQDHVYRLDIWKMDVLSGELTPMARRDQSWEEFGNFSPDGRKFTYMSSGCCGWDAGDPESIPFGKTLQTELYLLDLEQERLTQLTHINSRGLPGTPWHKYLKDGAAIVTKNEWRHDGRSLIFEMPFYNKRRKPRGSALWELSFAGPCGRS